MEETKGKWRLWTSRFGLDAKDEEKRFETKREAVARLRELVREMNAEGTRFKRISPTEYSYTYWDPCKPMKIGVEQET